MKGAGTGLEEPGQQGWPPRSLLHWLCPPSTVRMAGIGALKAQVRWALGLAQATALCLHVKGGNWRK